MLHEQTGGDAVKLNVWVNSFTLLFKIVIDTFSRSLMIKENLYNQMFFEKCNAVREAKASPEAAEKAENSSKDAITNEATLADTMTKLITANAQCQKYKDEVVCLKLENAQLITKLEKEIKDNVHLHTGWQMLQSQMTSTQSPDTVTTEKIKFLAEVNCIEVIDPVNHKGDNMYCIGTLPVTFPLYSPESVQFLKTVKPCLLAKLMRMNDGSWELLNVELKTKQERHRKQSRESEASHEESTSKE